MAKKAKAETAKKKMTVGRAAKGTGKTTDKVKMAAKKAASLKRGKKKPKIDPEVEAMRARNRALWKSQEQEATSIELARRGALVDERARVRSTMGVSWSNRKPR